MTSTETERDALNLTRDSLSLVVVSPDYFRTGEQHHLMPNGDDKSRTYYATASRLMGDDWAALIVGPDDPRGQIGWRVGSDYADLVDGNTHGGWNIRRQYLTPVVSDESSDDETRPLAVGDRVKISDTHPAGPSWQGHTGVVESLGYHVSVRMETGPHAGQTGGFRPEYLTRVAEDSPEATTGPETADETAGRTFTQGEVDRLVREARDAARREANAALEEFKETANARAIEYAESNGLCSQFERCMEDIGLMGRDEWREAHQREYSVEFIVRVDVSACDEDDAEDRAREDLYNSLSYPLDQNIEHHCTTEV